MAPPAEFEPLGGETYPETLEEQLRALEADEQMQRFTQTRQRLASDRYRPLYHFSAPENRLNDPNGLCQWRGRYHMFYQFWPAGADRVHWGHTVSDDLMHWEDLPVALYPTTERDCYSGQTVVESGRVIAIYHGTGSGNAIATAGDPLLLNWEKHPGNPVIPITPDGEPYRVFDPCIWKEEDGYYCLSGTYADGDGRRNCRNVDHLFRSQDLEDWEWLGPLIEDGFHTEPGEDGAVPNFWPIGNDKHMLLFFSHKRAAQYYVGQYDRQAHRLIPDYHGRMNYGPLVPGCLHAPSATIDDSGRFLAIFNLHEGRAGGDWSGMMTLPRHLWLDGDNALRIEPVPELESLRGEDTRVGATEIPANEEVALDGIEGRAMEIAATIEPGSAREVGLNVLRSPDGEEQTTVTLYRGVSFRDAGNCLLGIDISRASVGPGVQSRPPEVGPLRLEEDEPLELRIFLDRSCIEVFANGRQCLTLRVYPDREDSRGVSVFARGGSALLSSLETWQMQSIWPELSRFEGR